MTSAGVSPAGHCGSALRCATDAVAAWLETHGVAAAIYQTSGAGPPCPRLHASALRMRGEWRHCGRGELRGVLTAGGGGWKGELRESTLGQLALRLRPRPTLHCPHGLLDGRTLRAVWTCGTGACSKTYVYGKYHIHHLHGFENVFREVCMNTAPEMNILETADPSSKGAGAAAA